MTLYKLTDLDGYTRRGRLGETLWRAGTTVSPQGTGDNPCGPGVLHAYASPLAAMTFNPIHANIEEPRLWRGETHFGVGFDGMKYWVKGPITIHKELPIPEISLTLLVRFAILCVQAVPRQPLPKWEDWAKNWLNGSDRTARMAEEAAKEAATSVVAVRNADWAAEWAAVEAAWAAARAGAETARPVVPAGRDVTGEAAGLLTKVRAVAKATADAAELTARAAEWERIGIDFDLLLQRAHDWMP